MIDGCTEMRDFRTRWQDKKPCEMRETAQSLCQMGGEIYIAFLHDAGARLALGSPSNIEGRRAEVLRGDLFFDGGGGGGTSRGRRLARRGAHGESYSRRRGRSGYLQSDQHCPRGLWIE